MPGPALLDNRVDETLAMLRAAAIEQGLAVSGDDRVGESCAAALLGIECETLAKKRSEGKAPAAYKVPVGTARISYRLADLARWIEQGREDF